MHDIGIEYPSEGEMRFYDLGPAPQPGRTEVLIRTQYSGITNGTERHALLAEHGFGRFPGRHGYQHVGVIEAAGEGVEGFRPGDWVFFGRYVGHRGWHLQDVASADRASYASHLCIVLPDGVDRPSCALLGVAGVAMRAVRRCRVSAGQRVWVAGAGLIGQFSAQAARAVGAHVTITDVNEQRLRVAQEAGAHRTIHVASADGHAALQQGGPYDAIIDACGLPSLFLDIFNDGLLASRGVIGAIAARTETTFDWRLFHGREASFEVSCHFSLSDLAILLHLLQHGVIRIDPVISHRPSIADAPRIYATLRDRPGELLGVVFDWTI